MADVCRAAGDGLAALAESIKAQSRKGMGLTEEEKALMSQKQAELQSVFQDVQYQGLSLFTESMQKQSCLSDTWIEEQTKRMEKWLTEPH